MKKSLLFLAGLALVSAAAFAQADDTTTADSSQNTTPHLTSGKLKPNSLPSGTVVKMKLETGLSTASNRVGDTFAGRVTEEVRHNGKVVIPVGTSIRGRVTKVDENRVYKGRPVLELRPEQMTMPDGEKYSIIAVVSGTDDKTNTKVDSEGRVKGSIIDQRDKMEMAAGGGGGAVVGALITHSTKGALVGSMLGGGGAVVYWLTTHKSTTLPAGTEIVMEISRPMSLTSASD